MDVEILLFLTFKKMSLLFLASLLLLVNVLKMGVPRAFWQKNAFFVTLKKAILSYQLEAFTKKE